MAKNGNSSKFKMAFWIASIVFAAGVLWAVTNANSAAIVDLKKKTDKLEDAVISISKDIEYIQKDVESIETSMTEIVKALPK